MSNSPTGRPAPPGWYDSPAYPGMIQYWTGSVWVAQAHPKTGRPIILERDRREWAPTLIEVAVLLTSIATVRIPWLGVVAALAAIAMAVVVFVRQARGHRNPLWISVVVPIFAIIIGGVALSFSLPRV